MPPIGDVIVVAMCGYDGFPAGLARVLPRLFRKNIGRQNLRVVADLFAGNKVFVANEFYILLALGTKLNAVGGGAVLVAFVNSADCRFE